MSDDDDNMILSNLIYPLNLLLLLLGGGGQLFFSLMQKIEEFELKSKIKEGPIIIYMGQGKYQIQQLDVYIFFVWNICTLLTCVCLTLQIFKM